jgi:OOP family OmpA-OmpF porin
MNLKFTLPLLFATISINALAEGAYVLGEVTRSSLSLDQSKFNSDLTAVGATGLSSSDSGSGTQWRLQLGYKFSSNFALETGYIDLGTANYRASFAGGAATATEKAGGIDLAALGMLPLTETLSVFGKVGAVAAIVKTNLSSSAPAMASIGDSSTKIRPLLGVGATYSLQKNVDLRVDYDHVSGLGKSGQGGAMSDNMVSVGVAYNF